MASLWLALLPSLQDRNRVSNPAPGGPTNEMAQMAALADDFVSELQTTYKDSGIVWKVIPGRPYSAATYDLETLYEQTDAAVAWLNGSPPGVPSISYNLHSDAPAAGHPGVSHVAARVDSRGTHAEEITKLLCPQIAVVFATTKILYLPGDDYVYAKALADTPHVPLLIEHGDHTVAVDNLTLHTRGREVARAAIGSILVHYGFPLPPPPQPPPPDPWADVGEGLVEYGKARPWLGTPNRKAPGWHYWDASGDEVVKLKPSGAWLVWRKFTGQITTVSW